MVYFRKMSCLKKKKRAFHFEGINLKTYIVENALFF